MTASPEQVNCRGTHLSLLQIPGCAKKQLEELIESNGTSQASFTLDGGSPTSENAEECEGEVGWVCKDCRLVFPSLALLNLHQKMLQHLKGSLRLTQLLYSCGHCNSTSTTLIEHKWHLQSDAHKQSQKENTKHEEPDVADVVRQITALKEAAESERTKTQKEEKESLKNSEHSQNFSGQNKSSTSNTSEESKKFDKTSKSDKCKPKEGACSYQNKETNSLLHSEESTIEHPQFNNKDVRTPSSDSFTQTNVVLQAEENTYGDYSFPEHSISFVSNPNYVHTYAYQSSNNNLFDKSHYVQSSRSSYQNYENESQLQKYFNQQFDYQSGNNQTDQNYNSYYQHSQSTLGSSSARNASSDTHNSQHIQRQENSFHNNYNSFQSAYQQKYMESLSNSSYRVQTSSNQQNSGKSLNNPESKLPDKNQNLANHSKSSNQYKFDYSEIKRGESPQQCHSKDYIKEGNTLSES